MRRIVLFALAAAFAGVCLASMDASGDSYFPPNFWKYTGSTMVLAPTIAGANIETTGSVTASAGVVAGSPGIQAAGLDLTAGGIKFGGRGTDPNRTKTVDSVSGAGLWYTDLALGYYRLAARVSTGIRVNGAGISVNYDAANFSASATTGLLLGPNISAAVGSLATVKAGTAIFNLGTVYLKYSGNNWYAFDASSATFSRPFVLNNNATGTIPLRISTIAGQTASCMVIRPSSGPVSAWATSLGLASFRSLHLPPQSAAIGTTGNEGRIAFADSTNWNPGSGRGLYCVTRNGNAVTVYWKRFW